MDLPSSTKVVYERIREVDPDHVNAIVSYLLHINSSQSNNMIRLALHSDKIFHEEIRKVKTELMENPDPVFLALLGDPNHSFFPPHPVNRDAVIGYSDTAANNRYDHSHNNNYAYRRSAAEFSGKTCRYFIKGICKHGDKCKYYHQQPDSFRDPNSFNDYNRINENHIASLKSLKRLGLEITQLLISNGGSPIPIASLPTMYFEMYGKPLQAEGYLSESQRRGQNGFGFTLTNLLARLDNSIRLINRPNGQHAVTLAEDLPNYLRKINKQSGIIPSARQIYLTFPPESGFSEQDVFNHFNQFGPVQEVRIPYQVRRMYGFVTFFYEETVRRILEQTRKTHYVGEYRIVVKPYKEKLELIPKYEYPLYYGSSSKQFEEEQEQQEKEAALEIETRRISELQVDNSNSFFYFSMDDFRVNNVTDAEEAEIPPVNCLLDVLNTDEKGSGSKDLESSESRVPFQPFIEKDSEK